MSPGPLLILLQKWHGKNGHQMLKLALMALLLPLWTQLDHCPGGYDGRPQLHLDIKNSITVIHTGITVISGRKIISQKKRWTSPTMMTMMCHHCTSDKFNKHPPFIASSMVLLEGSLLWPNSLLSAWHAISCTCACRLWMESPYSVVLTALATTTASWTCGESHKCPIRLHPADWTLHL